MKPAIKGIFLPFLAVFFSSCEKEDVQKASVTRETLMAYTWQVEKVAIFTSGVPLVTYQRNAANNEEDYSLIRQTYKANGSVVYTDQFGDAGSNGTYELLNRNTAIKIGLGPVGLHVIGENLNASPTEFAYTLQHGDGDSTRFIFSPL